jgi:hypothetical protein
VDSGLRKSGNPVSGQGFTDSYGTATGGTEVSLDTNTFKSCNPSNPSQCGSQKIQSQSSDGNNAGNINIDLSPTGNSNVVPTVSRVQTGVNYAGLPHDYYAQWALRMDTARLTYTGDIFPNTSSRAIKQTIISFNDGYKDDNNWLNIQDCSSGEVVVIQPFNLIPEMYFSCAGYTGFVLGSGLDAAHDLYQNATGCQGSMDGKRGGVTISTLGRDSTGLVTVVTTGSVAAAAGNLVYIGVLTPPINQPSLNSTPLSGVYVVQTANNSTFTYTLKRLYETTPPKDTVSVFRPTSGALALLNANGGGATGRCWMYRPNQWQYLQVHVQLGSNLVGASDNLFELWAGYENGPSTLLISLPFTLGSGQSFEDIGDCASARSGGVGGCASDSAGQWWANQGLKSGFGRNDLMHYETDRCTATSPLTISNLARSGGVVTVTMTGGNWEDSSGGTVCDPAGKIFTISGTTLDGGSFNATYTVASVNGNGSVITANQTGNNVSGAPGGTPLLQIPEYNVNCNGGPCNTTEWVDEVIMSTKRIPDPGHVSGTNLFPDPPDHLAATNTVGSVSLGWTCNDGNGATYKIKRFTGTKYQAEVAQNYAQIGTAAACSAQYGTQTYTDATALAGTTYTYVVAASNASGDSTRSNPVTVTVQ